jgi:hypothetical protein
MSESNSELSSEELFKRHQTQTWADLQSASDEYDKAILALSGGGLTLSIGFIKDVVPLDKAIWLHSLLYSWVCFALALLAVVASYMLSVQAQKRNLDHLQRYYIDGNQAFLNARNSFNTWLGRCNVISGLLLFMAVMLTIVFAWKNISEGKFVSKDKTSAHANDGRPVISATPFKHDFDNGRQIVPATPVGTMPTVPTVPVPPAPAPKPIETDKK